ncbi:MAG: DNA (cytosine-5-)-methyltransferase [Methylococcales symbiont of Iophon sp. n. MRB-2018]|nr:MAG: DNA (cytosine-5-)-methyltransferase [Methylococcales symbiont of Iophon sp. n. MRB-2018]
MKEKKTLFSFIDLFSGIGGFKLALENNGGKSLGFSEINKDAIESYCKNFSESQVNNFGDITKIKNLPVHDLLTAGVPCQSWSIAGRNLGFDDDRGQLWNDTVYFLHHSKPKAFIFENVKGLVDPRNKKALSYILDRIKEAGYYANYHVINSQDYGVPQSRVRVYIIGFKNKEYFNKFNVPLVSNKKINLADILGIDVPKVEPLKDNLQQDLFADPIPVKSMSLSNKNGLNDYFLFNDLRNGDTTIHSWDIIKTTKRQKNICYTLLKNRRKSAYGKLDGNPLSFEHFQSVDSTISIEELNELVQLKIFKTEEYLFTINNNHKSNLSKTEQKIFEYINNDNFVIDDLKINRELKRNRIPILKTIESLKEKGVIQCAEVRYEFKNTKISTGLFGINRIFLPSSDIFPTLVASDSNDYITLKSLSPTNKYDYKKKFIKEIYKTGKYRKITKAEACLIQGFPKSFVLPESRARWMQLIGNSVSVPVIETLCKAILDTGVFKQEETHNTHFIVENEDNDDFRVKIGFNNNPENRIRNL